PPYPPALNSRHHHGLLPSHHDGVSFNRKLGIKRPDLSPFSSSFKSELTQASKASNQAVSDASNKPRPTQGLSFVNGNPKLTL
ncbi:hypothetical protein CCACVL1_13696, partial [Corchorus capsularis]